MSGDNWITGSARGTRQKRVDGKLRRREGKAELRRTPTAGEDPDDGTSAVAADPS